MPACLPAPACKRTPSFARHAAYVLITLSCFSGIFCSRSASAQADPTQFKTQSIAAFGGYLHNNVDIYPATDSGVTFGLDFTRYFRFPVAPSLEGRINLASGTLVNQKSYLGGLKAETRFRKLHPYANFLIGYGTVHYNPASARPILGDNSTVYSPGVGVDIDLAYHFRAKVDYQHQYWKTGHTTASEFQPNLITLGLSYQLPFRPFHKQGEPHY